MDSEDLNQIEPNKTIVPSDSANDINISNNSANDTPQAKSIEIP
jgi:hypothetical protein